MILVAVVLCARTKEIVKTEILLVDVIALILVSKKQNM